MASSLAADCGAARPRENRRADRPGVLVTGAGTPVVLLHSSLGSKSQWAALAQRLASRYRVIAPDLCGYGDNPASTALAGFALDDEVRLVAERVDALVEPHVRVHVIGHSYGGLVALRFAQSRRGRVASLSLYEPVAFRVLDNEDPALKEVQRLAERVSDLVALGHAHDAARAFVDFWNGEGSYASLALPVQVSVARRVAKLPLDFHAAASWPLDPGQLRAIVTPTLLLTGCRSPAVVQRVHAALSRLLPKRWLRSFDAGHMAPVTDADRINPWFESFLDFSAEGDTVPRSAGSGLSRFAAAASG